MTVAAVILSATAVGALEPTRGQPRVRRLADLAWSGGALPIVVVAADPDGRVKAALAGSEAIHASPAPDVAGSVGQIGRGVDVAISEVSEVTAVLIWPDRMTWVGPETITSLIETHGTDPDRLIRPTWHGDPGWPVLLPVVHAPVLSSIPAGSSPDAIRDALVEALPSRLLELGDPGVTHDVSVPLDDLPSYEGPPEPPGDHRHEWGEDVTTEAGLTD